MKTTILALSLIMASSAFAGENCNDKHDESRDPASHSSTMTTPMVHHNDEGTAQVGLDHDSAEYHFKFETPGGMRK